MSIPASDAHARQSERSGNKFQALARYVCTTGECCCSGKGKLHGGKPVGDRKGVGMCTREPSMKGQKEEAAPRIIRAAPTRTLRLMS